MAAKRYCIEHKGVELSSFGYCSKCIEEWNQLISLAKSLSFDPPISELLEAGIR